MKDQCQVVKLVEEDELQTTQALDEDERQESAQAEGHCIQEVKQVKDL